MNESVRMLPLCTEADYYCSVCSRTDKLILVFLSFDTQNKLLRGKTNDVSGWFIMYLIVAPHFRILRLELTRFRTD